MAKALRIPQMIRRRPAGRMLAGLMASTLIAAGAMAQEGTEASPDTIVLDTVYIHGSGVWQNSAPVAGYTATGSKTPTEIIDVPAQVSVVTAEEMKTRAPDDLMQALSYTSSVKTDEYGSDNRYDFFRIRGFSAGGIYRDGLPLRTFNFTGGRIEPYSVERIEVLKGATSTLFGLNAPGGMINVITKRPLQDPFGEIYASVGEDHAEIGVDTGAPLDADGVWTYRLTAKWQDSTDGSPALRDDRRYIAPALTWSPSDRTTLTLLASFYQQFGNTGNSIPVNSTRPHDTYFGEPDFSAMDRTERAIGYEFTHDFGGGLTFRQNARYSNFDMLYQQAYVEASSPTGRYAYLMRGEAKRMAVDTQLQYETSFGATQSRSLVGLDYTDDDVYERTWFGTAGAIDINNPIPCGLSCISLTPSTTTDMSQKALGLYLQEELTFNDRWILTLGGRYDRVKTDVTGADTSSKQSAFTKRIGLTYKATEDLSFYGNYSESFDPLATYYTGTVADPKPVRAKQYEAGVKYRPQGTDALVSFALFDLDQSNVLRRNNDGTMFSLPGASVRGVELEGRMPLLNDQLNLNFAYAYWDARIEGGALDGNRPQLTPRHVASLWADYSFASDTALDGLKIGAGARLEGKRFADDANTTPIGSAVIFDAMASYPIGDSTEIAVNVTNLFDRDYVATMNFDNTAAFYGDARAVKATLRHRW